MNQDQLLGIRKQFTGWLKETWGRLTHNKTLAIAGRRDQLIGTLQERHGYKEEIELHLTNPVLARKLDDSVDKAFETLKRDFE